MARIFALHSSWREHMPAKKKTATKKTAAKKSPAKKTGAKKTTRKSAKATANP
jgi:topoisomerase IA-like protein